MKNKLTLRVNKQPRRLEMNLLHALRNWALNAFKPRNQVNTAETMIPQDVTRDTEMIPQDVTRDTETIPQDELNSKIQILEENLQRDLGELNNKYKVDEYEAKKLRAHDHYLKTWGPDEMGPFNSYNYDLRQEYRIDEYQAERQKLWDNFHKEKETLQSLLVA